MSALGTQEKINKQPVTKSNNLVLIFFTFFIHQVFQFMLNDETEIPVLHGMIK